MLLHYKMCFAAIEFGLSRLGYFWWDQDITAWLIVAYSAGVLLGQASITS